MPIRLSLRSAGRTAALAAATIGLPLLATTGLATAVADSQIGAVQANTGATTAWALQRLDRARRLRPDISLPWRLSAEAEDSTDASKAYPLQLEALRLAPDNWANWQELATIEFQLGHGPAALKDFRKAAQYSAGYEAHYELANAAYLLGDQAMFWQQMQRALDVVPVAPADMVTPTMQDIVRLEGDHPRRLAAILPPRRSDVQAAAIRFLAGENKLAVADELWRRLTCPHYQTAACAGAAKALVEAYLQTALADEKAPPTRAASATAAAQAEEVWAEAVQRGMTPGPRPKVGVVADPDFRYNSQSNPFGWQGNPPDLQRVRSATGNSARVALNGYEPSDETLLWQWLVVQPKATYVLKVQARGANLHNPEGIVAEITTPEGRQLATVPIDPRTAWSTSIGAIVIPAGRPLMRLALAYHRPLGVALMSGTVWIRSIELTKMEGGR